MNNIEYLTKVLQAVETIGFEGYIRKRLSNDYQYFYIAGISYNNDTHIYVDCIVSEDFSTDDIEHSIVVAISEIEKFFYEE